MKSEPIQIRCHAQYNGRPVDLACTSLRYHSKLHDNYRIIADVVDGEGSQANLPEDAESCKGLWLMFVVYFEKTGQSLALQGQIINASSRTYHSQRQRVLRIVAQSELSQFFTNSRTGIYYSPKMADVLNLGIRDEAAAAHCNQHTEFRFAIDDGNDKRYPQHFQLTQYLEPDADFWRRTLKRHGAWFNFYQPLNALPTLPQPIQLCVGDSNGAFNHTGLTATLLEFNDREGDGLYQLTAGFGPPITQIKAYYYDESTGQTLYATRQVRPGPVLTADIEVPFTHCTQAQVDTFADTLLECLQVQRLWIRSKFQGMALQAGDVLTIDVKSIGEAQPCLLTEVIYNFLPQQKPNSLRKPNEEPVLDTDLNFAQEHSFVAHPLKAHYRVPMIHQPDRSEPRYNGVMPGVFAETDGKDTVTPDSQGRIPLKFPYRYSHFCNGAKARYTRLALPLNSGEAGMSFPYYADTEFLISFANGSLDKPLIRGTAATGKTGHIHSPELQQRSAHVLPQGQQLLYTNTLGNTTAVKLGTTHQEGDHETFLMLNNLPSQTRPGDKHLDFIHATSASSEHQITGNLTEKLGGNKIKGAEQEPILTNNHWIQGQLENADPGTTWKIEHSDGTVKSGTVDANGCTAKLTGLNPGTATITFGNASAIQHHKEQERAELKQTLAQIVQTYRQEGAQDQHAMDAHGPLYNLCVGIGQELKGVRDGFEDTATGIVHSIFHPLDTVNSTAYFINLVTSDSKTDKLLIEFANDIYFGPASAWQQDYLDGRTAGDFVGGGLVVKALLKGPAILGLTSSASQGLFEKAVTLLAKLAKNEEETSNAVQLTDAEMDRAYTLPKPEAFTAKVGKNIIPVRVRLGTNGKVAVIGRSMGDGKGDGVRLYAQALRKEGYEVETFSGDIIPEEAEQEFQAQTKRYTKVLSDDVLLKTKMYSANRAWAEKLIQEGYMIVDIGNPNNLKVISPFYEMEKQIIFGGG